MAHIQPLFLSVGIINCFYIIVVSVFFEADLLA